MGHLQRVVSDPAVCGGAPCIQGTRVLVSVLLDALAEGLSPEAVAAEYPPVTVDDVRAALAYAAEVMKRRAAA